MFSGSVLPLHQPLRLPANPQLDTQTSGTRRGFWGAGRIRCRPRLSDESWPSLGAVLGDLYSVVVDRDVR